MWIYLFIFIMLEIKTEKKYKYFKLQWLLKLLFKYVLIDFRKGEAERETSITAS